MSTPASRNIIQGADLGNLDVRPQGIRSGNTDREKTRKHIQEMERLGYLKEDEARRRLDFIDNSDQKNQLSAVINDLPAPKAPEEPFIKPTKFGWHKREWYMPIMITGIILGALVAIIPAVFFEFKTPVTGAISSAGLIIGGISALALFFALIWKLVNE
jgi:hypothetical protein